MCSQRIKIFKSILLKQIFKIFHAIMMNAVKKIFAAKQNVNISCLHKK